MRCCSTLAIADRRAVLATPTPRGRAFFADACEVRTELEAEFLGRLSPSRAATFVAILGDLVDAREI
jgi:DNA-binding MarR family transcriptional regulator